MLELDDRKLLQLQESDFEHIERDDEDDDLLLLLAQQQELLDDKEYTDSEQEDTLDDTEEQLGLGLLELELWLDLLSLCEEEEELGLSLDELLELDEELLDTSLEL